ncbi:MAG: serine/threonine-protein kinase [Pirellulales bacterium]
MSRLPLNSSQQAALDALSAQAATNGVRTLDDVAALLAGVSPDVRPAAAVMLLAKFFAACIERGATCDESAAAGRLLLDRPLVEQARRQAEAEAATTDPLPRWRGRFSFIRPLGTGGYGRVGLFRDGNLGRDVAIKLPRSPLATNLSREVLEEVQQTCRVRSARVVKVHDLGWLYDDAPFGYDPADPDARAHFAADRPAIVMDYLGDGRLLDRLQGAPLHLDNVATIFREIARGVEDIHGEGMIHSDLKPANILFGAEGLPRIADLGLARAWFRAAPQFLGGTRQWMSPEVLDAWQSHRPIRPKREQDIWSLGVILYEMLTGQHPFRSQADYEAKILTATYLPVHRLNPQLAPSWQDVIRGCLDEKPERRFSKIADLLDAVEQVLEGRAVPRGGGGRDNDEPPSGRGGAGGRGDEESSSSIRHRSDPLDSRAAELFVGHSEDLAWLDGVFGAIHADAPALVAVLHAMGGMGKTYLVDRWLHLQARQARSANQPESFLVSLSLERDQLYTAERLRDTLAAKFNLPSNDVALRLRSMLSSGFLRIDNVDTAESFHAAAELAQELNGCRILVCCRSFERGALPRGWREREIRPLTSEQAEQQFRQELESLWDELPRDAQQGLLDRTRGWPLAIHLVTGQLLSGRPVKSVLGHLPGLPLLDASDPRSGQTVLRQIADESLRLLEQRLQACDWLDADQILRGFRRLGYAVPSGVGRSLAAAISGLSSDDLDELLLAAGKLHLLDRLSGDSRFQIHSLLAEQLRREDSGADGPEASQAAAAITDWFCERLPKPTDETATNVAWHEIHAEHETLVGWLEQLPDDLELLVRVERAGSWFAGLNGPFGLWRRVCERGLALNPTAEQSSHLLWILTKCALSNGDPETALEAARRKAEIDRDRGAERGLALALGAQADVLARRGEWDEALQIRWEEELPVYERLGDIREKAVTMGKIGDVLAQRGEWDEALRIWREEELPVYKRLGDIREKAIAMGRIADVLAQRGEWDEALRIRREEQLPVYERLGDIRSQAVTMGKIADVLAQRGEWDEALRIRREEVLPIYEQLGARRDILVCRAIIAIYLLQRARTEDRPEAATLLRTALVVAEEMQLPEAQEIRELHEQYGLT